MDQATIHSLTLGTRYRVRIRNSEGSIEGVGTYIGNTVVGGPATVAPNFQWTNEGTTSLHSFAFHPSEIVGLWETSLPLRFPLAHEDPTENRGWEPVRSSWTGMQVILTAEAGSTREI